MEAGILDYFKSSGGGFGGGRSSAGGGEIAMDKVRKAKQMGAMEDFSESMQSSASQNAPSPIAAPQGMSLSQQEVNPQFGNMMGQDPQAEALKRLQYGYGR
jgi:hypothetical protein